MMSTILKVHATPLWSNYVRFLLISWPSAVALTLKEFAIVNGEFVFILYKTFSPISQFDCWQYWNKAPMLIYYRLLQRRLRLINLSVLHNAPNAQAPISNMTISILKKAQSLFHKLPVLERVFYFSNLSLNLASQLVRHHQYLCFFIPVALYCFKTNFLSGRYRWVLTCVTHKNVF